MIKIIQVNYSIQNISSIVNAGLAKDFNQICGFNAAQKWTLLYRGSRDGFQSFQFHDKCDDYAYTLTIIKTTKGFIFGGYTEAMWDKVSNWRNDNNAFLFSLVNPKKKTCQYLMR